jgi:hypothetical protein
VLGWARQHVANTVEIHAGAEYIECGLADALQDSGLVVLRPLQGLGLGEQLAWYGQWHSIDPPPQGHLPTARSGPTVIAYDLPKTSAGGGK